MKGRALGHTDGKGDKPREFGQQDKKGRGKTSTWRKTKKPTQNRVRKWDHTG